MTVSALNEIFGGDVPAGPLSLGQIAARASIVYVIGVILVRLGKSRLLSRATPLDVILAFMLGSVLSRGINGTASLSGTVAASATLIVLHWAFTALACRSHVLGSLFKGNAQTLVSDGVIDWSSMRRSHISEHDLMEAIRLNANLADLTDVKLAVKERSGEIGIVRKPRQGADVVEIRVAEGVQTVRLVLVGDNG